MFEHESVHDLMSLAHDTPYGKTCSALWAEAARRAGAEGLEEEELWCYLQLASAFTMGGEVTRMVAPFMWVDKRRKERPDLFDERMQSVFAWYYKYLILVLRDVPQASVEQCFSALGEMRNFYKNLGDSLKAVYLREFYVYSAFGYVEEAEEAYQKWKVADVSELSDCVACDPQHEVLYLAHQERWQEAVEVGEKALANSEDSCSAQPENLYSRMLIPWLRTGRDDKAWPAHVRAMQRNSQRSHFLEHIPEHLLYLELSGSAGRPQRLQRGLDMAIRFLPWWLEAETPMVLMEMAVATARVFAAQPIQDQELNLTLPGESLPWVKVENLANPTLKQASQWCAQLGLKIAEMFDSRQGMANPHVVDDIRRELYDLPPVPQLPDEGAVEDASGQFSAPDIDYRITSEAITQSSQQENTHSDDNEEMIVAIDIHGPWRGYTEPQLLAAHEKLNTQLPTIYSQRLGLAMVVDLETAEEEDLARNTLLGALRLLADDKYMDAARAADTAMRIPTEEPIGVRLSALRILGETALKAGYYEESCEASRHRLNIAAACGLHSIQLEAATTLVQGLIKQQSFAEAAEVAHTVLAAIEHAIDKSSGFGVETTESLLANSLSVRWLLVSALSDLDLDSASAQEALRISELTDSTEEKFKALDSAFHGFRYDHEYSRAFAAGDALVNVADSWLLDAQAEAIVDEDAQAELADVAEKVAKAYLNVAMARAEQPALVDDAAYDRIEELFKRRLDIQIKHLVSETKSAEFFHADSLEDRGLAALHARRFDEGWQFLDAAAAQFLDIDRPLFAARAWNAAARAKLLVDDLEGAQQYLEQTVELLSDSPWEHHKAMQEARELLEEIADLEDEA
ncbi:hypothetical protein [Corynebacterium freiburgense]|uniref:hypothetical protein n=1 Tax=Corynebacterium freiburgense TaxID=556548 RepID=UPI0004041FE9|nr:hypothetical protein [Corynebacterium freiburgense]WJZ03004.1 hypothetical protein CFREI_08630 [Corynebacterium freiburgense]